MAIRNRNGQPFGGGKHRPAFSQHAGSFRPTTNGSGHYNNGWNGQHKSSPRYNNQNNRMNTFIPHQNVNFGGPSQNHPPNGPFRQKNTHPRRNQKGRSQNHQGGNFNAPKNVQFYQNNASSENPAFYQNGFQDHLRVQHNPHFIPRGPRNPKWQNHQNQANLYNAVQDVNMVDASNLDTDIEMPDAPPLESYYPENQIYNPAQLVADGIAAANAMLSRIESFIRTGTINQPV